MIRINSPFGKTVAVISTASLVFCMTPGLAWAKTYKDTSEWMKSKLPKAKPALGDSRILSARYMKSIQGKSGQNPYAAGQQKVDVMYKGVDLMSGNFTTSGTDLTFEGGYGIPVNMTRSYSANDGDEGPLGLGWTVSVDVRSTAGGLMKSGTSSVRSVPTNFKERPSAQLNDPNSTTADGSNATQPIQAVLATDAGGTEETIQRDADGILSTPPWDKNKIDSVYETQVATDGTNFQVMISNVVNTPEGTVYVYSKQGKYTYGVVPYNSSSTTPEPSNILKISSATDRQGNVTNYTYNSAVNVSFSKVNGQTTEHPLTKIQMPNGHYINLVWGTGGTANRIIEANDYSPDNSSDPRRVTYGYTSGMLTSVTTPGGKTTTYGYGSPYVDTGGSSMPPEVASDLMTTITDCRGLTTTVNYEMQDRLRFGWSPVVVKLDFPNNQHTVFSTAYNATKSALVYNFWDYYGSSLTTTSITNQGQVAYYFNGGLAIETFNLSLSQSSYGGIPTKRIDYNPDTLDVLLETNVIFDYTGNDYFAGLTANGPNPRVLSKTELISTSNFLGSPLTKTAKEYSYSSGSGYTLDNTKTISYAYWGADKYYQQKAVKDQGGRLSYTDYYDSAATPGKRGQTYRVYDQARANIWLNPTPTPPVPAYAISGTEWRYQVQVVDLSKYSAQFDYDSKGRATDVWKIQKTTTSPWTYVQTKSTYGTDAAPIWGAATQVVEDYGGINRTTQTIAYDSYGRAIQVKDASNKEFHTYYDKDGVISSIKRVDGTHNDPVVTYTYGTSGITNGAVLTVTDNLSGVVQSMSYGTSGSAIGMPVSVSETNGSDTYSSAYTYNSAGDRDTVTYTTQAALGLSATTKWKYSDYLYLGLPTSASRAPQRLTSLDSSTGNPTSEEFHYAYDFAGRLRQAAFAQTPSATPTSGNYYYASDVKAATRARTFYEYDAGGRTKGVYNWWDTLGSGSYTSAPIRANECSYEASSLNRGLKIQNKFYNVASGAWNLQRTETYGYDPNLDYLTSANYGDGLANATPSWTYDAAGNRASDSTNAGTWTYDNLNRMTASPNKAYTNDILGNRLSSGVGNTSDTMTSWDDLNRMTQLSITVNNINTYAYRADGLRVSKSASGGASSQSSTLYRYDGQMGIEDVDKNSSGTITAISRFALGSRGIDAVSRTTSSGTVVTYPLYDAHGNGVGSLSKSGSSWSIADERTYDAWGGIRSGSTSDTKGRYCANLGHKQDDESGLVYMQARFFEPTSGRFVSQDPGFDGSNWYVYCGSDPINRIDRDGRTWEGFTELQKFLHQYGPIGDQVYTSILAACGGVAAKLVLAMNTYASILIKDGNKEFAIGMYFAGIARGGGGFTSIFAGEAIRSMGKGIMMIAMGYMMKLTAALIGMLYTDSMTEGGFI